MRQKGESEKDGQGVVEDGEVVRVTMMMMDSLDDVQRSVLADQIARSIPPLHRPGFAQMPDTVREARDGMYDEACRRQSEAWRQPFDAIPTSAPPKPALTGDALADARAAYIHRITNAWRGQ